MAEKHFILSGKGVKMKVDLKFPLEDVLNSGTIATVGQTIKNKMLAFMGVGVSPVTGKKFEKYKNPDKYPKNVRNAYPDKRTTPVNLKLSGKLWESLGWKKKGERSFEFGMINADDKVKTYGAVHNKDDMGRPDIPERKFLPTKAGEEFNRTIMLELKRIIVDRLKKLGF